jgi:hypothetical protein
MSMRLMFSLVVVLLLGGNSLAADKPDPWASYRFLFGEWVGEGDGKPGKGSGGFSFSPDLDGKILVRKNRADIPASNGRAAVSHDDLLIVYRGSDGRRNKAVYFDNEDHVIEYTVAPSTDGKSLAFTSEPSAKAPRFRLTYVKIDDDKVAIKFEIAPPGHPDQFRAYLSGTAKRIEKPAK